MKKILTILALTLSASAFAGGSGVTMEYEGVTVLPRYNIHYLWIHGNYFPAKLEALNAYFETVLAVSVYAIPLLLLLNVELFKKFAKEIKKG